MANPAVAQAGAAERARALGAAGTGMSDTLKTGGQGDLVPVSTAGNTLGGGKGPLG
jgi:hypothetical protein